MLEPIHESLCVSRETHRKLIEFQKLVAMWSPKINLVATSDMKSLWTRHTLDSAQLASMSTTPEHWVDLGSGGGFPGIVVAILLHETNAAHVSLVESDRRKCAFLITAAQALDLQVDVIPERIESLQPMSASTLSARALSPLVNLVAHAHRHLSTTGTALFPKGRQWRKELEVAKETWSFDFDVIQSGTDVEAAILKLRNIKRRKQHD